MLGTLRTAVMDDLNALEKLIDSSARELLQPYYSPAALAAAIGTVFAVDELLVLDRTYFVIDAEAELVACGGWSRRPAEFGGNRALMSESAALNPTRDAARIRAFFVAPGWTRRGFGRRLLAHCESAARDAGFTNATLVATLSGEPLYAAAGFAVIERFDAPLPGGLALPVVRMVKSLA